MKAKIWFRQTDEKGSLDSRTLSEGDYDLHDGYVKMRDDQRSWTVLPMHRVLWISLAE